MNCARLLARLPKPYLSRIQSLSKLSPPKGLTPYLVGGVVRDLLLGVGFRQDCDITFVGGTPESLARERAAKWKLELLSYPQFHTFTLRSKAFHLDLITARREVYAHPAALPKVEKGDLSSDLQRRDFTVNAMAVCLASDNWGELVDPYGGARDLKSKTIRALHRASFIDDPTRIFRAARYAGRFGFRVEPETQEWIDRSVREGNIRKLSRDRIRVEIQKILLEDDPVPALALLARWGVWPQVDARLLWMPAASQRLARIRTRDFKDKTALLPARTAALLADQEPGLSRELLKSLKFEGHFVESVYRALSFSAAFRLGRSVTDLARPEITPESLFLLEILARSSASGRFSAWAKKARAWALCRPHLTGADLSKMGYPPGPLYKEILEALTRGRFEGRLKNRAAETRYVFDNFRRD